MQKRIETYRKYLAKRIAVGMSTRMAIEPSVAAFVRTRQQHQHQKTDYFPYDTAREYET